MLIAASIISIILGSLPWTSEHPETGWSDGVAILVAVVIVVCVRSPCANPRMLINLQVTSGNDYQKQKQFQKLDAKKNDRVVKCVRNGEQMQASIFDVRVGDVLLLETGDIVSADALYVGGHGTA